MHTTGRQATHMSIQENPDGTTVHQQVTEIGGQRDRRHQVSRWNSGTYVCTHTLSHTYIHVVRTLTYTCTHMHTYAFWFIHLHKTCACLHMQRHAYTFILSQSHRYIILTHTCVHWICTPCIHKHALCPIYASPYGCSHTLGQCTCVHSALHMHAHLCSHMETHSLFVKRKYTQHSYGK